ncbi:tetrapyrrole methylase family protein/MazG family protein [Natranaerovirga hydrolytica]|uniref:Tetrapyrrole methylase family protein/MazG family protein n=1 Tax=Natranaerovirga hydrolytica TaxID=680378 RepID=A0A4R1MA92_9FIRM|nr:nucleoside triphosphate pyrophosphohydrolase [Natranaerovirga hydrolytica]TCK87864.1 tetrapyrrole methylase family protein/MazG family protein [Natranaerovirga hydrolytica]
MSEIIKDQYELNDLIGIMKVLRGKDGCPWDKEQTHSTLKESLIEEAYEVIEAINNNDNENLCEELGDLLLQVVFHAQIAKDNQTFNMGKVITTICQKLIRRHPHIFSNIELESIEEVNASWEAIKKQEKKLDTISEDMKRVPKELPALLRAKKVQKKAKRVGFDFQQRDQVIDKIKEELEEFELAYEANDVEEMEEEYGDLLFTMVNLSRFFNINPEFSLTNATEKFITRFEGIETLAQKEGYKLESMSLEEMDNLWKRIK